MANRNTSYTEQQEAELFIRCRSHGITPPTKHNYILDTVYDALNAIIDLMDKERKRSTADLFERRDDQ